MQLIRTLLLATSLCACAHASHSQTALDESENVPVVDTSHIAVAMPGKAAAVRDDRTSPILQVATVGSVVYPSVYGYPLYPEGDAARGIAALRHDNWTGARQVDREDEAGVIHATEELPQLGCRFDGVRENVNKYVPVSLTCDLPAPKALGGSKRPVLGGVMVGAKADQILREQSVREIFLGEFHLTSNDFAAGSGTGYFNTTHGQLALVFARKKLSKLVYYFDPGVKGWQNPALWTKP
jgi:hypothetical protein